MKKRVPAHVLIVDDEFNIHYSFQKILSGQYRIFSACSAEEGLERIPVIEPAAILLDLKMPGLSGWEFLRRLRRENPEIPVIVMTAHEEERISERVIAAGGYAFVAKPFAVSHIRRLLDRAVRGIPADGAD